MRVGRYLKSNFLLKGLSVSFHVIGEDLGVESRGTSTTFRSSLQASLAQISPSDMFAGAPSVFAGMREVPRAERSKP